MTSMDTSRLIPLPDAARLADVSEAWMRRLVQQGRVKGIRIGKFWFIDRDSAATFERHPSAGRPRGNKRRTAN